MATTLEFYAQQLQQHYDQLPPSPIRESAMALCLQSGWPNKRQEQWKYTTTQLLQQQPFVLTSEKILHYLGPDELSIVPLSAQVECAVSPQDSTFVLLNQALWQEGLYIHVKENQQIAQTLKIHLEQAVVNQAGFVKIFFVLDQGAELEVMIDHTACLGFSNLVIQTTLAKNAKLTIVHHGKAAEQSIHFIHHQVQQAAHSKFTDCSLSLCAQWLRYEVNVYLQQEYARCVLLGLYWATQQQHHDYQLLAHHQATHTDSNQFYKGVVDDHANVVFQGTVVVEKYAQKACAQQKNNTILLSKTAEIDTKPALEIYADDVRCSHGATIGELPYEHLFYLMTRGIESAAAKKMLIAGFIKEVLTHLPTSLQSIDY